MSFCCTDYKFDGETLLLVKGQTVTNSTLALFTNWIKNLKKTLRTIVLKLSFVSSADQSSTGKLF